MSADPDLVARYAGLTPAAAQAYPTAVTTILLRHRSVRDFSPEPLPPGMLEWLIACAQSAPTKSDLQGMSVVVVDAPALRAAIAALVPTQRWVTAAPTFLVWCPDMRRNKVACDRRQHLHQSNTLDTFLNVSVDTALCMQNFAVAAASLGLGTCNVSVLRNASRDVADLLGLPAGVYPLAGTCVGYPAGETPAITPRLPQRAVMFVDRYDAGASDVMLEEYDRSRRVARPYPPGTALHPLKYPPVTDYGWLEHTARRMEQRERPDFRDFIEAQGFSLD